MLPPPPLCPALRPSVCLSRPPPPGPPASAGLALAWLPAGPTRAPVLGRRLGPRAYPALVAGALQGPLGPSVGQRQSGRGSLGSPPRGPASLRKGSPRRTGTGLFRPRTPDPPGGPSPCCSPPCASWLGSFVALGAPARPGLASPASFFAAALTALPLAFLAAALSAPPLAPLLPHPALAHPASPPSGPSATLAPAPAGKGSLGVPLAGARRATQDPKDGGLPRSTAPPGRPWSSTCPETTVTSSSCKSTG